MEEEDRMEEDEEVEDIDQDISTPDVVTKYKMAADIANNVLAAVVKETIPGKKIVDLCVLGDKLIMDGVAAVFKANKDLEKGVAFPTAVSTNHCVGHFSPLLDDTSTIAEGDVCKIDLGVHIDGFIVVAAHTTIATSSPASEPVKGRKADVICAAHFAAELAHRLIKPGGKNTEVTAAIAKAAEQFKCNPVEGVLSHQMKRFVIDGNKVIANKDVLDQKVEEFEFEENEVYQVDIIMSTGDGKAKEVETRTTIYKRAVDQNYLLKMKASRYLYNEISQKFPTLPFTLRALDEKRAKLGITECIKHDLIYPYPVLYEKPGEYVAQFKFTVLLTPNATDRITSHPLPHVASDYKIDDAQLNAILAMGTKRAKKSKKGKKKKGKGDGVKAPTNNNNNNNNSTTTTTTTTATAEPMEIEKTK